MPAGGVRGGEQHIHTGNLDTKRKRTLKLATWNKGGANQELKKKRNEKMLQLLNEDIDCLGVTEANLRVEADMEEAAIPGYVLEWDSGRDNKNKKSSRVVVFIKEELSCDVIVGFIYQEHIPWGTQNGSVKEQETRLKKWLESRKEVWIGKEEVFMLGDINLDILRRGDRIY